MTLFLLHLHSCIPFLKKCILLLGIFIMSILKCVFLYRMNCQFGTSRTAVLALPEVPNWHFRLCRV